MEITVLAVVVAIFALVFVAAFLVFRQRVSGEITGPLGTSLKLDASNAPPSTTPPPTTPALAALPVTTPAVKIENAESLGGGLVAEDRTGRGVDLKDVKVKDDILASSELPGGKQDPKA